MEFLAVVTVLIVMQVWGHGGVIQRDDWLQTVYGRLASIGDYRLRLALAVLLPVLAVMLVQSLLTGVIWGLPLLLFYIAILLYSLGRGDFSVQLEHYYEAWHRGDLESAYQYAQELEEFDAGNRLGSASDLHQQVRKAVFYEGFERWFVVVFWFVLLGPAAALAYRLFKLLGERPDTTAGEQSTIDRALYYIEWLPARALSFTFSIVGNFEQGMQSLGRHLFEGSASAEVLDDGGCAALAESGNLDQQNYAEQAETELRCAQKLLSRSVICWVGVFALLQLI